MFGKQCSAFAAYLDKHYPQYGPWDVQPDAVCSAVAAPDYISFEVAKLAAEFANMEYCHERTRVKH